MEKTFHMLLYRAFHAQRAALRPHMAELGLGPGQPKLLSTWPRMARAGRSSWRTTSMWTPPLSRGWWRASGAAALSQRARTRAAAAASWSSLRSRGARPGAPGAEHYRAMEEAAGSAGFDAREQELFADLLARAARNLRAEEAEKV